MPNHDAMALEGREDTAPEISAQDSYPTEPDQEDGSADLVPYLLEMVGVEEKRAEFLMRVVIPLGAALVEETDYNHLLERILLSAMSMCRADGGALYLRGENDSLRIVLFRRESLGIALGGSSERSPAFSAISLADLDTDNKVTAIAARAAALGQSVSECTDVPQKIVHDDVAGVQAFDAGIGYQIYSALAVPLRDSSGRVAGVIELSNARRPNSDKPVPFESAIQRAVEALSLLAAAALKTYLQQEALKNQVRQLRVQIDDAKKERQVQAIISSDYFQNLKARARDLRTATAQGADPSPSQGSKAPTVETKVI